MLELGVLRMTTGVIKSLLYTLHSANRVNRLLPFKF